jgi:hypothetical protein
VSSEDHDDAVTLGMIRQSVSASNVQTRSEALILTCRESLEELIQGTRALFWMCRTRARPRKNKGEIDEPLRYFLLPALKAIRVRGSDYIRTKLNEECTLISHLGV